MTTVLIVDDEPNVVEAYALWLKDEYDIRTAEGGEEALEQIDGEIDVVLLDRRMPRLSGDEVLEAIHERGLDPRVAMVTAVDPDFDIVDMSFDAYLTKPVTKDDLVETVEQLRSLEEYESGVREQFALAEKRAVLETEMSEAELAESEEYQALLEDLERIDDETVDRAGELDHDAFAAAVRNLVDDE
jgi:two-component system response regulator AdeR